MSNYQEILKFLDVILEDLTEEQKNRLTQIAEKIKDPSKITATEAKHIVDDVGLDIEKLQKNARRKRAEELNKNRKPKIGANEKCPCNSGKKYKKCCIWK